MPKTMKAYVLERAGGPEQFQLKEIPIPEVKPGWVLVKIKAFGINRSEWFTRNGQSPSVKFPRVLGIECVGEIIHSLHSNFPPGKKVAALMGGMGRSFDGSYAEFALVPESTLIPFESKLSWEILGALPEMLQTTHGSLYQSLSITTGQTLLIRGGTSSIGLCALEIARNQGLRVIATTRSPAKLSFLKDRGATEALLEHHELSSMVREQHPQGIDAVLDLVGATTILDSLLMLRRGGTACMTGILGGSWEVKNFLPMEDIPTAVRLTSYSGESNDLRAEDFQRYIHDIESGHISLPANIAFTFLELREAHKLMDTNSANGKIVVVH